jgi:hypothetical protein
MSQENGDESLKIINKQNYISNEQLKKLFQILGKEHTPRRIIIFENKLNLYLHRIVHFYNYKELLSIEDYYNILNDTIYLMVNKLDDEEKLEIEEIQFNLIRDLAYLVKHRHYFEDYLKDKDFSIKEVIKNLDIFSANDINYGLDIYGDGRYDHIIDKFVVDFMNGNKHLIKEIMNWEEEYELED